MTSSGPERSIGGISIPQWMKSKISDRYNLEQSAFSPPTDDDGFFLIRYPKAKPVEPEPKVTVAPKYTPITKVLESQEEFKTNQAFSQHTAPCQEFLPQAITPRDIGMRRGIDPAMGRVKSTGTDDGFKGEGAACGYSVVAVAQQMLSEKNNEDKMVCPKTERIRRNSKSLPASPQSSPKFLRKNPYFTNVLFGSTESMDSENTAERKGLLVGLLSTAFENQKSSMEDVSSGLSKISRAYSDGEGSSAPQPKTPSKAFRAKPSELREMNFWSPTSM